MGKSKKTIASRVNFFDGQRVVERDLDEEQAYNRFATSNIVKDFHGNGVVRDRLFGAKILLDTSNAGAESSAKGLSKDLMLNGRYDGKAIYVDFQPTDKIDGNRIEFELIDAEVLGRIYPKVLVIGRVPNGTSDYGELSFEILHFKANGKQITKKYYKEIVGVIFNNFSGGTGRTYRHSLAESSNLIGTKGRMIIRESDPLLVFPNGVLSEQVESPNFDLINFVSSDPANTLFNEIELLLGPSNDISSLYLEMEPKESVKIPVNGAPSIAYGQKFLSKSDNIQRIDILLSVEKNNQEPVGSEFNFSGEIVVAIHKLSQEVQCITDVIPDNLIDFHPESDPLIEISYDIDDLYDLGYILSDVPQVVSFNFSNTLIADKNIDPSIEKDEYYAFMVSRRGDNTKGSILIEKGYDRTLRKIEKNQEINIQEKYSKQTARFVEYDSVNSTYADDRYSSLWHRVVSSTLEVTDGSSYSNDGFLTSVPKNEEFIGGSRVPRFERFISLDSIRPDSKNYIAINRVDNFSSPATHPRTGNFIFSRIGDTSEINSMASMPDFDEEYPPILLASAIDTNTREAQRITGTSSLPGFMHRDEFVILNPTKEMLDSNLINRVLIPDIDCECNSKYRIIDARCEIIKVGDLDSDGEITSNDIALLLNLVGNTINSPTTEKMILNGDISIIDILKSDLNGDGTVDWGDIEKIENAVEGFFDFDVSESFNVLKIKLENIHSKDDFPSLLKGSEGSGSTSSNSNIIKFSALEKNEVMALRSGDIVSIADASEDDGLYIVSSKSVDNDGLGVSLTVSGEDGGRVEFAGSSGLNIEIISGKRVNLFADNLKLLNLPFESKTFAIDHVGAPFEERFVEICDLRRFVETNFIEESKELCICEEELCETPKDCSPKYKNQKVISNDLFIPDGEIYSKPGVPYHGDYEYANISIPLPPGSIQDCSIDLYDNFIKAYNGTCKTASGYPAMVYSDGTYVGCEDDFSGNDISKGRVKITKAIASLHVDAFVDGYTDGYIDGYADESIHSSAKEIITETFIDASYKSFSSWDKDGNANDNFILTANDGDNNPAILDYTTIDADKRFYEISPPNNSFSGDFIVDFRASRSVWESDRLVAGNVYSYGSVIVKNNDGTYAKVKLGWRQESGNGPEIFFSGEIFNEDHDLISDFNFGTGFLEHSGNDNFVFFRLRRINEVITGLYFDPNSYDITNNPTQQMIKIGENPDMHPGSGDVSFSFGIYQDSFPTPVVNFSTKLIEVNILSDLLSSSSVDESLIISRDSDSNVSRATITFPLEITSRTYIHDAYMILKLKSGIDIDSDFNIFSFDNANADNLGRLFDMAMIENDSYINHIPLGSYAAGDKISIPITSAIMAWAISPGHLPGQYKALVLEPGKNVEKTLEVESEIKFEINIEDRSSGIIFKVGVDLDHKTGIATLNTKNIIYDALNSANRTVLNFGVHLKKSAFKNSDVEISIQDLNRIGIGTCMDEEDFNNEKLCFFIAGSTATGTFVEGPFPCNFHLE